MLKTAEMKMKQAGTEGRPPILAWITRRYTRQGLWSLFLMCAFPLQAWTLILGLRDVSWLTDRTNAWDAVGVVSYGLVYAFFESLIFFMVMLLLGYLISTSWSSRRRVAVLTVLALMLCVWAMLEQLFFLAEVQLPGWLIGLSIRSGHPLWILYGGSLITVGLTMLVPVWLVLRSERGENAVWGMIDRLSILTMFYLLLDVIGLVIVVVRNV
jgi:hypothetical protein